MQQLSSTTISVTWEPLATTFPWIIRGFSALIIVLLALMTAERMRRATVKSVGHTRADSNTALFVGRLAHLGTVVLGILIALGILGISWTALLAVVGAISLAMSLAIQDVLKNFVSGLYLLMERPFRVGDSIKVRDFVGDVEDIGIRTTMLRTRDGQQVIVPSALMFTEIVVNLSAQVPSPAPGAESENEAKVPPAMEMQSEGMQGEG